MEIPNKYLENHFPLTELDGHTGDIARTPLWVQVLSGIGGFLGAFFLALFMGVGSVFDEPITTMVISIALWFFSRKLFFQGSTQISRQSFAFGLYLLAVMMMGPVCVHYELSVLWTSVVVIGLGVAGFWSFRSPLFIWFNTFMTFGGITSLVYHFGENWGVYAWAFVLLILGLSLFIFEIKFFRRCQGWWVELRSFRMATAFFLLVGYLILSSYSLRTSVEDHVGVYFDLIMTVLFLSVAFWKLWKTYVSYGPLVTVVIGIAAVLFAYFGYSPGILAATLFLGVAYFQRVYGLLILSLLAWTYGMIQYYFELMTPLWQKSLFLGLNGFVFLLTAYIIHQNLRANDETQR